MVPLLLLRLKRRSKSQAHIPLAIFASSAILAYSWSRAISHEHRSDISTPVSTPCSHWCPGAQWISFSHYWQHISHPVEASRWRQVDDQPKWKSGEQHFVMPSNWSFNNRSSWSALKANEQKKVCQMVTMRAEKMISLGKKKSSSNWDVPSPKAISQGWHCCCGL